MIEINLIPDVKQELLRAQAMRAAVISGAIVTSIVAGAAVVLILAYVFGVQTVRTSIVTGQIKEEYQKLSSVEDLSKVLTIQNQLTKMSELNSNKKIDSRIFNVMTAVTPPEVQISQIDLLAETSTISISGQTADFNSLEVFKKTLDSAVVVFTENEEEVTVKLANSINTGDVSYGQNSDGQKVLMFTLSFTYAEELFSPAIAKVDIKLSVDGNVTDSYLGVPRSIFTERATQVEDE